MYIIHAGMSHAQLQRMFCAQNMHKSEHEPLSPRERRLREQRYKLQRARSEPRFGELPLDLLNIIAAQVCEATGHIAVGSLRRVCAAWRDIDFSEIAARCPRVFATVLVARLPHVPVAIAAAFLRAEGYLLEPETARRLASHAAASGRAELLGAILRTAAGADQ